MSRVNETLLARRRNVRRGTKGNKCKENIKEYHVQSTPMATQKRGDMAFCFFKGCCVEIRDCKARTCTITIPVRAFPLSHFPDFPDFLLSARLFAFEFIRGKAMPTGFSVSTKRRYMLLHVTTCYSVGRSDCRSVISFAC